MVVTRRAHHRRALTSTAVKVRDGATASRRVGMSSSSRLVSQPMRRDSEDRSPSQMLTSIEDRVGDRGNRRFLLQTVRRQGSSAALRLTEAAAIGRGKVGT